MKIIPWEIRLFLVDSFIIFFVNSLYNEELLLHIILDNIMMRKIPNEDAKFHGVQRCKQSSLN